MRLETERLLLRPLRKDDLEALAALYADPEVMRYIGGRALTREESEASLGRMMRWFEQDGFGQLAVVPKETGQFVGRCGIFNWETDPWTSGSRAASSKPTETEIGYALARPHWGLGYATEAATAVRDYAQTELGEERLIALIQHGNDASKRVAEKLGMKYEREVQVKSNRVGLYALGKRPAR